MQKSVRPEMPRIERASPHDSKMLADILSDSFLDDPVLNWVIPDKQLYPAFYRMLIDKSFAQYNHMYKESAERGAALWLPPGATFHIPMGFSQLWLTLRLVMSRGLGVLSRLEAVQQATARHHPDFPHYYLQSVGTRQAHQGQGVGSALLKAVLPRCDAQQMPAYLESSNEKNVPLYERHGFEIQAQETLGEAGPHMWFMLRQPRQD
jgi:GNAT superfamily N-acetyltransferase